MSKSDSLKVLENASEKEIKGLNTLLAIVIIDKEINGCKMSKSTLTFFKGLLRALESEKK